MIRSLFSASGVNLISGLISYALIVHLSQIGSDGSYAEFLYFLTWALLITSFLDFASESVFVKYARYSGSLNKAFSVVLILKMICVFFLFIILTSLSLFAEINSFKVLVLILPIFYLGPAFEFLKRNLSFAMVLFLEKVFLFSLIYYSTLSNGFGLIVYKVFFISNLLSILVQLVLLRKSIKLHLNYFYQGLREYIVIYYPMYFVLQLNLLYGYYTRLIIEYKNGLESFASAAIALQIIAATSFFQSQVDKTFRTPIFNAIEKESKLLFMNAINKYLVYSTLPIIFGCMVIYFSSDFLVNIFFSKGYSELAFSLKILSITPFTINLMRLGDALFTGAHLIKYNLVITFIATFLLVIITQLIGEVSTYTYLIIFVIVTLLHGIISIIFGIRNLKFLFSCIQD